uniref:Uncharacterized protein n=1 Tax=Anguilla anguilla TaxID=7936 RepID=A0A0E9QTT7_ANGAN
MSLWIRASTQC